MATFDHIHIYAADVETTMQFYADVFGAEPIGSLTNRSGGVNHLMVLGGQYMAISAFPDGMSPSAPTKALDGALDVGFGIAHFGVNVDDIDALLGPLSARGCALHAEPRQAGPLRYAYVTAPDGVVIELTQYVLPPKLRAAGAAMRALNAGIHVVRRWIGRRMLAAAT